VNYEGSGTSALVGEKKTGGRRESDDAVAAKSEDRAVVIRVRSGVKAGEESDTMPHNHNERQAGRVLGTDDLS